MCQILPGESSGYVNCEHCNTPLPLSHPHDQFFDYINGGYLCGPCIPLVEYDCDMCGQRKARSQLGGEEQMGFYCEETCWARELVRREDEAVNLQNLAALPAGA